MASTTYRRNKLIVNEYEGMQANYKDSADIDILLCNYFIDVLTREISRIVFVFACSYSIVYRE